MMKIIERIQEILEFQNEYGSLFNDIVKGPTGITGRYLRWQWAGWGVIVDPVYRDQFILRRMYRYSPGVISIEFPGGGVEDDEDFELAAKRELLEEFGMIAEKVRVIGNINPDTAIMEKSIAVAEAIISDPSRNKITPDDFEAIADEDLICLEIDKFMEAIAQGNIFAGTTMAAALLYLSYSNR